MEEELKKIQATMQECIDNLRKDNETLTAGLRQRIKERDEYNIKYLLMRETLNDLLEKLVDK